MLRRWPILGATRPVCGFWWICDAGSGPVLPGIGDGPNDRPLTYTDYLLSFGMAHQTVRAYSGLIKRAEETSEQLGFPLPTTGYTRTTKAQLRAVAEAIKY